MTPGLVRRLIIHSLVVWATMPLFTTNRHIRQTSSFWCVRALSTTPSTQPPKPTASTASALNDAFRSKIEGQLILAPLTRGGNLPFRRLCSDFGMEVSYSEMVYSRFLVKGDRVEATRLRRPDNEKYFGVQIATNQVDEGVKAMQMAYDSGADFVDLNCGCPIYEATRRGLGSSLLRSPKKLEQLVAGMVQEGGDRIPLSVKIRLGCSEDSINVKEVVDRMRNAGAAAVTIHARTARQGYRRPADWDMIRQVVEDGKAQGSAMPIIGNGDILTHYEATRRMEETGVNACMVGRGALIKPWIFQEFKDRQEWEPTLSDRIEIYYKLTSYMKDYFGSDDLGRKKASYFLPWHFSFFNRYRSYPEESFCDESLTSPLIHRRIELPDDALPLDILFQHSSEDAHTMIADTLWNSGSSADAVQQLQKLAESKDFQEIRERAASEVEDEDKEDTTELANVPKDNKKSQWKGRKGRGRRGTKPDRTPEEIAAIRAQRAAKKARLEAEQKSLEAHNETIVEQATRGILSRRAAFQYGGVLVTGSILTTLASQQTSHLPDQKAAKPKPPSLIPQPVLKPKQEPPSTTASSPVTKKSGTAPSGTTSNKPQAKTSSTTKQPSMIDSVLGRLEPINLTQVASETNINVTLTCSEGCISVDSKNFTKIQQAKFPPWFPSWLKKSIPPKVVKQISDPELLVASTVAGASMEMFRTGLLYPLSTIKVRVQQDRHNFTCRPPPLSEKIVILGTNIKEKVQEGNLYAGSK
jgi:tRNA-dihydrouridine synthase 3